MDLKQRALLFGQKLKKMRLEKGYSVNKLASIAKISPSSIRNIEKGSIHITYTKYAALAPAFDLTFHEMFSFIEK